jgi:SAM-dependent methyltransferase
VTAARRDDRTPVGDAVAHYEALLERHGAVAPGVGWNGEFAQNERFAQLCEILPRADEPLSVLDFGCGFGSLAEFLAARRRNFTYFGYDASATMIDRARERFRDPRIVFDCDWARVPACDYVVASGVFNVRGDWSDDRWWSYILETLRSLHERTTKGWAANFLTSYSDPERMRPELYYADPLALFDWCKRNLSRLVALHHDYPLFDFTILVRKEAA